MSSGLMNRLFNAGVKMDKIWFSMHTSNLLGNQGAQRTMYNDLLAHEYVTIPCFLILIHFIYIERNASNYSRTKTKLENVKMCLMLLSLKLKPPKETDHFQLQNSIVFLKRSPLSRNCNSLKIMSIIKTRRLMNGLSIKLPPKSEANKNKKPSPCTKRSSSTSLVKLDSDFSETEHTIQLSTSENVVASDKNQTQTKKHI